MTDTSTETPAAGAKVGAPISTGLPRIPRGPRNSIRDRYERLAFAAACASKHQDVIDFWYRTMMDDSGNVEMPYRIACSKELMNRAYGMPIQVTSETRQETTKQILEVRWLPPDPNDHSRLIEPEPD